MKRIEIEISRMLPIESPSNLNFSDAVRYSYNPSIVHPPKFVPYKNYFITLKGHRRIISRLIRKEQVMIGEIAETDEEVDFGEVWNFLNSERIPWLIEIYEKVWRPTCLKEGIRTFYDYLRYIDKGHSKPEIDA